MPQNRRNMKKVMSKRTKTPQRIADKFGRFIRVGSSVKTLNKDGVNYDWRVCKIKGNEVTIERKGVRGSNKDISKMTLNASDVMLYTPKTKQDFDEVNCPCFDKDRNSVWMGDNVALLDENGIEMVDMETLEDVVKTVDEIVPKEAIMPVRKAKIGEELYSPKQIRKIEKE